jgi:hypothetical protein
MDIKVNNKYIIVYKMDKKKQIGTGALAIKYGCTRVYVYKVVRNGGNSVLARKIRKDADDLMAILDRDTVITL